MPTDEREDSNTGTKTTCPYCGRPPSDRPSLTAHLKHDCPVIDDNPPARDY
jgi:hypothetical protein